jgi:hypothetical protein
VKAFRLLPRRFRFRVARRLAVLFGPLYRFTPRYKRRPSLLDGYREEVLRAFVFSMTGAGVLFDPELEIRGSDVPPGGAIFAGAHFLLNGLFLRWLLDHGHRPLTIANQPPGRCYAGTSTVIANITPGPSAFVEARRMLRDGRKIVVNIDDRQPHEGWIPVETGAGTKYVSDAVMRFAEKAVLGHPPHPPSAPSPPHAGEKGLDGRHSSVLLPRQAGEKVPKADERDTPGIPVVFVFVRIEQGRVIANLTAAPRNAEASMQLFLERFKAEAAAVSR